MIKPGDIIRHKNFKDVAILVLLSSINPETNTLEIDGVWCNQGFVESYIIKDKNHPTGISTKASLSLSDLEKWEKCLAPESKLIREEKWVDVK